MIEEEKEDVAMMVEWLRENEPTQNRMFEEQDKKRGNIHHR